METGIVFALAAFGVWGASQRVLASQLESNPSVGMAFTRNPLVQKLNVGVDDPRRKNIFTSADKANLMDENAYNTLKYNAKFGQYHSVINWWDAGEINQMPSQRVFNPITQYAGGPEQD
jgi:hypothetical protein